MWLRFCFWLAYVLDEATSSIDIESDHIIQRAIREHFNHCTVLTITHRLHTIIDCDRILVMDAAKVAEFGTPRELITQSTSLFSQLVAKTDEKTANLLRAVALGERKMKF
jgi:ATP-binding cassette, subfamily C (CFTR/MRP), member 1